MTEPLSPLVVPPSTPPKRSFAVPAVISRVGWPLLALAVLLAYNAIFTPGFFSLHLHEGRLVGSLVDVLNRGSPIILLALGQALVIATGGVDLSVGAIMAFAGAVAACLIAQPDYSPIAGLPIPHGSIYSVIAVALLAAVLAGLWNGALVVGLGLQPIIATLVLMVAGRGIAQLLTDGQIVTFSAAKEGSIGAQFAHLGSGTTYLFGEKSFGLPTPILIALAVAVVIGVLTRATSLGLFLESSGNSPKAARMAGVPTARVKLIAYAASGLCAGIAGMILAADIKGADANNSGLYSELDAILAVSLGGTALAGGRFSLAGAVAGAILIQTLTTTINMTTINGRAVDPAWTLVIKGVVVIAVCLLQSEAARASIRGLFSRKPAGGVA